MYYEDVKILARAGFTAGEIRAMLLDEPQETQTPKGKETPQETPKDEAQGVKEQPTKKEEPKAEAKENADYTEVLKKLDVLTKAIQAGNRLSVENNNQPETVDDILKTMLK